MMDSEDIRLQKLRDYCNRNEVRQEMIVKLRQLEDFEIVCLCDDSGSMNAPVAIEPGKPKLTRWTELQKTIAMVLDLAVCLDKDGVDVYFLNRPPLLHVSSVQEVGTAFASPAAGQTPSTRVLQQVLEAKRPSIAEGKLLIVMATDGQPTDDAGNVRLQEFSDCVRNRHANVFLSIVACTNDESCIDYLDALADLPNLEVSQDYTTLKQERMTATGNRYTFGDYVSKVLLGAIDPAFSNKGMGIVQQKKQQQQQSSSDGCCVIS